MQFQGSAIRMCTDQHNQEMADRLYLTGEKFDFFRFSHCSYLLRLDGSP
jgi:hypothetical protein